jgi:PBSX family phage portal protein
VSDSNLARESLYATLLKAAGADDNALASNVHAHEEEFAQNLDGLPCPYPPEPLVRLYERSSALRPCVEAMVTNVHAFRHRLVPRIDLEAADADQRISDCILAARLDNGEEDPPDPTEQEIATKRAEIARGIKIEAIRLNSFFRNCSSIGWTQVRKRIATDLEVTGNGYLEVVRDAGGRISKLNHCPAVNMRLRALEAKPIKTWRRRWVGEVDLELEEVNEKPRGFVQRVNMDRTFFKAFGDPRVIGASNGAVYDSPEAMPKGEREATEIVHFGVFAGRTSYGVPRWIGAVFEVLGIEAYSQVNYLGFDNKGIPPLAVTVSGGTLGPGAAEYLENYMKVRMKGRMNYHSVLLLEAVATNQEGGTGGRGVQVGIQPLTQPQDAVYLEYANRSEDIVARQWRISPITRGKVESTFNKATAEAALKKDEEQVFQPARAEFDEQLELTVLLDLGVRYHRVESNSPVASDPDSLSVILERLVKNNVLTPNEARKVASNILNTDLHEIAADWAKQPAAFTLNGIPLQEDADDPVRSKMADAATTIQRVLDLRAKVHQETMAQAAMAEAKARADEAGVVDEHEEIIDGRPVTVVRMLPEAFAKIARPHGAANDAAEDQDDGAAA